MTSPPNSSEIPKLLIVGRTRVGKGTFILTSHRILGEEVISSDIVSHGVVSHTREPAAYSMRLNGRDVEMIDTVGFDDSNGTDVSQDTLLRFLSDTKTGDFYPPLVILMTLSGLEKDLLKKMEDVFSKVVVAFRLQDGNRLEAIEQEVLDCGIKPVKIFHLQEFVAEDLDPVGIIRKKYERNVSEILKFYETLTPARDNLDFSSPLFAGDRLLKLNRVEKKEEIIPKERTEKRTETRFIKVEKIMTFDDGGHYEICNDSAAAAAAAGLDGAGNVVGVGGSTVMLGAAIPEIAAAFPAFLAATPLVGVLTVGGMLFLKSKARKELEKTKKWVQDKRQEVVYETQEKDVELDVIVKEVWLRTYKRDVHEVWKILAGEIEIFTGYEEGDWEVVDEKLIESSYKEPLSTETP